MFSFVQLYAYLKHICHQLVGAGVASSSSSSDLPFCAVVEFKHELPPKNVPFVCRDSAVLEDVRSFGYSDNYEILNSSTIEKLQELELDSFSFLISRRWTLWAPSDMLMEFIDTIDTPSTCPQKELKIIDIGAGSGRDLAWLKLRHEYHEKYLQLKTAKLHLTGVDHDPVSGRSMKQLFQRLYLSGDNFTFEYSRLLSNGVRSVQTGELSTFDSLIPAESHDIVLCMRYMPPRESFDAILKSVRPGGYFAMSQFADDLVPGTWILSDKDTTAKYSHPKTYKRILRRNELSELCRNDFEIICDKIHYLEDGRPLLWFLGRKKEHIKITNSR